MRHKWIVLAGLLVVVDASFGQQAQQPYAPPQSALDPQNNPLDALLLQWEAKMKAVENLQAQVERQEQDDRFRTAASFEGVARYKKPNYASLDMQMKGRPEQFEKFVCTGTFVYVFVPESKEVRVYEQPAKSGQVSEDNFLSFLFDIRAEDAKKRYDLSFFKEPDNNYYYLKLLPRTDVDKQEFKVALLALSRTTLLPRTLMLDDSTGKRHVRWDIPRLDYGANLDRQLFAPPAVPKGWQLKRMPKQPEARQPRPEDLPPRVVRPKP
jgi:TIGR03009 family protein